ncbi:lytic transglycosylase domain-containing protein [Tsuneonella sp. HG094]
MIRKLILGLTWAGSFAVGGASAAQEFHIFDHDYRSSSDVNAARSEGISQTVDRRLAPHAVVPGYPEAIYLPLIQEAEIRYGLPPRLLQALVWAESRFNPLAVSPAGAAGLAQLMPATARELGVTNRHDPQQNIDGGARYLRQMLDRFGSVHLALAAYNAGPGTVTKAGGIPKNRETPGYVRSVLDRWMSYAN